MQRSLCCLFALFAVTVAFAWHSDEPAADAERPRFARDAEAKKFAYTFAKRSSGEQGGLLPRFARDLDDKSKFAFAFAKRGDDMRRFARDLGSDDSNSRFAFAKRALQQPPAWLIIFPSTIACVEPLKTLRMARVGCFAGHLGSGYGYAVLVMGFIFGSCDLPVPQCQALREQQVCILGWALLFLWLGTILYMTREMWCVKLNTNGSSTTSLIPSSPKTSTVIEIE